MWYRLIDLKRRWQLFDGMDTESCNLLGLKETRRSEKTWREVGEKQLRDRINQTFESQKQTQLRSNEVNVRKASKSQSRRRIRKASERPTIFVVSFFRRLVVQRALTCNALSNKCFMKSVERQSASMSKTPRENHYSCINNIEIFCEQQIDIKALMAVWQKLWKSE